MRLHLQSFSFAFEKRWFDLLLGEATAEVRHVAVTRRMQTPLRNNIELLVWLYGLQTLPALFY